MFNQLHYEKLSKANSTLIAITNNHLDGIKYIYSNQKSYISIHDQYSNTQTLKIAEQLKDVKGIEYIYIKRLKEITFNTHIKKLLKKI